MKKILLSLFSIIIAFSLCGQDVITDSLTKEINQTNGSKKIALLIQLADSYSGLSNEKAIYCSHQAVKLARESENQEILPESYYSLGYNYYRSNQFDSALVYFNQALTGFELTDNISGVAKTYNRIGYCYQLKSQNEKALEYFNHALFINKEIENNKEIGRTLTNIAGIFRTYGQYEKAVEYYLDAIKLYEAANYQEGIAWISLNIARLLKELSDYDKATQYVTNSMKIYAEIEKTEKNKTGTILCLNELGTIYHKKGDAFQALKYSERVLMLNQQNNNRYGIANSLATIGKIYFELGKTEKAVSNLQKSLKIKAELNDSLGLPAILNYLGEAYLKQSKLSKAKIHINKAHQIASNKNLRTDQIESYLNFSKLYSREGDYKNALKSYVRYTNLKDSLNVKEITQLQMQYEFDKKQKQLEFEQQQKEIIQKEKLRRQKIITIAFVIGFVFTLVLAFVIYINYKRKKETNIQLRLQNEEIRQQKEEIEAQRDEIESQKNYAEEQRDHIAKQQKEITHSIRYASRIQKAILPHEKEIANLLPEHFIFYSPKNMVSGDFYWFAQKENKLILVAADCTGHGVPGAFMSMLGISLLNEIVNRNNIIDPPEILNQLRKGVMEALHQHHKDVKTSDGMDMTLCQIDLDTYNMEFSGAYNPIYIIREINGEPTLHEIKGDKMPVGVYLKEYIAPFTKHEFKLEKGDRLYMFSDGYYDQFGNESEIKFLPKRFRELLLNIQDKNLLEQKDLVISNFENWKGDHKQMDDVLVMGFDF